MKKLIAAIIIALGLTTTSFAQPAGSDTNNDGCVSKEEIITFYTVTKPEVAAKVFEEDEDRLVLVSPLRDTSLTIFFTNGCAEALAYETPLNEVPPTERPKSGVTA